MKIKGGKSDPNCLSAEEEKIREELLRNGPIQKNFIGYYYDGIHDEDACTKIDKQSILS